MYKVMFYGPSGSRVGFEGSYEACLSYMLYVCANMYNKKIIRYDYTTWELAKGRL